MRRSVGAGEEVGRMSYKSGEMTMLWAAIAMWSAVVAAALLASRLGG